MHHDTNDVFDIRTLLTEGRQLIFYFVIVCWLVIGGIILIGSEKETATKVGTVLRNFVT